MPKNLTAIAAATALGLLLAGFTTETGQASDSTTPPVAYEDGREYPAENGKAAVIQERPTPPTMPADLSARYTKIDREVELHPENYTGFYQAEAGHDCPPGLALIVGVVRGKSAEALARMRQENLPSSCAQGVSVQETDQSSAAVLYRALREVHETLGAHSAAINWPMHKVIAEVPEVTDELRAKAFDLYGGDVALDITENPQALADRGHDTSPFYAGARFYSYPHWNMADEWDRCAFGIPWKLGTDHSYTITAGHCLPYNTSAGSGLGAKTPTWTTGDNGYGAGRLHTNSAYGSTLSNCATSTTGSYGDIALLDHRFWPLGNWLGRSSANRIWQGGENGTDSAPVTVWGTYNPGDVIRVSGSNGDMQDGPNWVVQETSATYNAGNLCGSPQIYQQTRATKGWGQCPMPGDSGGPVSEKSVDVPGAFSIGGVISGGSGGGGDGYIAEWEPGTCTVYFTAARYASYKWGGGMN